MILLLCIEQNSFTFLINTVMDFIQKLKIKQNNEFEGEVRCASRLLFLQMKSFLNSLFLKETVILYIQSMTVFFVTSPPPRPDTQLGISPSSLRCLLQLVSGTKWGSDITPLIMWQCSGLAIGW